jgi:hypothetical protein
MTVSVMDVEFESHGDDCAGHLFVPTTYEEGDQLPGLVVTGAWMTVKEQMPDRYARELAGRGFAALTFDFRGWGESGGDRRQYENPEKKIEDILAAVEYLRSRGELDPDPVGGVGVCASSGYITKAATRTDDIASLALVAPWLHDREIVEATYGGPEAVERLIETGREAQMAYEETDEQTFVPAASMDDDDAIMIEVPYYTEEDRGAIPEWRNEADPAFWEGWLTFDAIEAAPSVSQPFFMIHSEAAAIPQGASRFYEQLQTEKGELWLDGVAQFDFYDQDEPVTAAADAVATHFRRTLGTTDSSVSPDIEGGVTDTLTQQTTTETIERFFDRLEAMDIEGFLDCWADDGVQEMPFAPEWFPDRLDGREAIENQYGRLPDAYESMSFERTIRPLADPEWAVAEYVGSIELPDGDHYDNTYVGLFHVVDGQVVLFREYFDPIVLSEVFGEDVEETFNTGGEEP